MLLFFFPEKKEERALQWSDLGILALAFFFSIQLEAELMRRDEQIGSLKMQLLEIRKMQESGSLAAFGRQSAALKERSSLISGQTDLAKKLQDANKKSQQQRHQIESLESQLDESRAQNGVFTSALIPILEDSGLFLQVSFPERQKGCPFVFFFFLESSCLTKSLSPVLCLSAEHLVRRPRTRWRLRRA